MDVDAQTWPEYFTDQRTQDATFDALVSLTSVGLSARPTMLANPKEIT